MLSLSRDCDYDCDKNAIILKTTIEWQKIMHFGMNKDMFGQRTQTNGDGRNFASCFTVFGRASRLPK